MCALSTSALAADATATLNITGKISPHCAIDLDRNSFDATLTDGPGNDSVGFSIDCNERLNVFMSSRHGGLKLETSRPGINSPGFISFLPYLATFAVTADGAKPVSFESKHMVGGAIGAIGVAPYRARGRLDLSWKPTAPLIGGSYSDIIEIRVSGEGETGFPGV
jgi:hypothetical protein